MNIDFNSFFRMRVNITKTHGDQFHLEIERVDLEDNFYNSKTSFFLNKDQLQQLVDYLNEVNDAAK